MHPQTLNLSHYRFPSRGHSYISIPSEAFHEKGKEKFKGKSRVMPTGYLKMILLENRFWFAFFFQVTNLIALENTDCKEAAVALSH